MTSDHVLLAPASESPPLSKADAQPDTALVHTDYDRRPLVVEHFEHYVDLRMEGLRFRIG
jgi:hypothetical protein